MYLRSPMNNRTPRIQLDLTLPLEQYTGTYSDPGYGTIILCAPSSSSSYCQDLVAEFAPFESDQNDETSSAPRLYAALNPVWGSHVRFVHDTEDTFRVSITALFPDGYGRNTTPFETWDAGEPGGQAKFVVEDGEVIGFGLLGTVGETTERERLGGGVKDVADAWLEKTRIWDIWTALSAARDKCSLVAMCNLG